MSILCKILLAVEFILAAGFAAAFPFINSGNAAGLLFCAAAVILTADIFSCRQKIKKFWSVKSGRIVLCAASLLIGAGVIYAGVLSANMIKAMNNEPKEPPELIVVLGCQVRGDRPSRMLKRRLDTAYDVLTKYPESVCVVSGGQGSDEVMSESECMKNYLTEKGINGSRIISEDRSTSTEENIRFTFELTDREGYGRDITIITDGYHQYRASLIAKSQGAESVSAFSAPTELRFLPTYWVREWLGITYFFVSES